MLHIFFQNMKNMSDLQIYLLFFRVFFGFSSFLLMIGFYCSAIYISENRDIRKLIKNDILKYNLLSQMGSRFIEDKTISYINQIRKSTKNELFIDYSELFLKDEDIKQYIKNVINEISKKKNNEKE